MIENSAAVKEKRLSLRRLFYSSANPKSENTLRITFLRRAPLPGDRGVVILDERESHPVGR